MGRVTRTRKGHTAVSKHIDMFVEDLKLANGSVETTPNHRFFTLEHGWTTAGSLHRGDHVLDPSDGIAVRLVLAPATAVAFGLVIAGAISVATTIALERPIRAYVDVRQRAGAERSTGSIAVQALLPVAER
jgi:hypothetical protein